MFGLVLVSDGQNEGPINNVSDIYCSAFSPLVWDNLGLFHLVAAVGFEPMPPERLEFSVHIVESGTNWW